MPATDTASAVDPSRFIQHCSSSAELFAVDCRRTAGGNSPKGRSSPLASKRSLGSKNAKFAISCSTRAFETSAPRTPCSSTVAFRERSAPSGDPSARSHGRRAVPTAKQQCDPVRCLQARFLISCEQPQMLRQHSERPVLSQKLILAIVWLKRASTVEFR